MNCPYCQTPQKDGARFCNQCGSTLSSSNLLTGAMLDNRYEIMQMMSKGGMGALYKVKDHRLMNRVFALKEMLDNFTDQKERNDAISWFKREAEILCGEIRHPNIPVVMDFFIEKGRYYLVMDFIEGSNLEHSYKLPLDEKTAREFSLTAVDILDYLHSKKIIHRDIKPENFILEKATGKIFLVDFGTATIFSSRRTNTAIGTQGYASPEHYEGKADERSDIFSLGATLHRLITGVDPKARAPFTFEPVRALNNNTSPAFTAIVEKALQYKPENRFQSASEMKKALLGDSEKDAQIKKLQSEISTLQSSVSTLTAEKSQSSSQTSQEVALKDREIQKLHQEIGALQNMLSTLTKHGIPSDRASQSQAQSSGQPSSQAVQAPKAAVQAQASQAPKAAVPAQASQPPTAQTARIPTSQTSGTGGSQGISGQTSQPSAQEQPNPPPKAQVPLFFSDVSRVFAAHKGGVFSTDFSRDGDLLASGGADRAIRVWSISSGRERTAWVEHYYEVNSIAFSPDGAFIASASRDTSVKVKKADGSEKSISLIGHMSTVFSVAFSPGGTYLASGSEDMRVLIWETKNWTLRKTLDEHRASVTEVAFSPTGKVLASAALDGKVFFFDTRTWVKSSLPRGDEKKKVHSLAFSPQRTLIACGLSSGEVELWDVTTRTIFRILQSHKGKVNALSFSPDGSRLFTGGEDGLVRIWDPQAGAVIKTLERTAGEVLSLSSSRDGRLCAAGNADGTLRIWSIERLFPAKVSEMPAGKGALPAGASTPASTAVAAGGAATVAGTSTQGVLKAASGDSADEALAAFEAEMSQSTHYAEVSPGSASASSAPASKGAMPILWPDDKRAPQPGPAPQPGSAPKPGSSPQSVSGTGPASPSGIAQKIPMKYKPVRVLEGHPEGAECAAFSATGLVLAVGCGNGEIRLWYLDKPENTPLQVIKKARRSLIDSVGEKLMGTLTALHIFYPDDTTAVKGDGKLEGHFGNVSALYFSMSDTRLITASCDGQLISWHYPIKDGTRNVFAYNSEILCAALSPAGSVLALGSRKEVVLLDYENGVLMKKAVLDIEDERANGVAFSPGGKILACGIEKGLVELWDVKSASLQSVLKGHKARVSSVAFSPDGMTLASGSLDGTVKLWDVKAGLERVSVKGDEKEGVLSVEFHPREALLLSGGFDGTARLWDTSSGKLLSLFEGHTERINEISFSSDGSRCATCGEDDKVLIWNVPHR